LSREILVNHARIDEETLAAFLDGNLPPAERASVLREIANNPESYSEFLDAASVAAAANADIATGAERTPRRWRRSTVFAGTLLAAAGIAAVIFVPRNRTIDTVDLMQRAQLASATGAGSVNTSLGSDWDRPGWSVVRGSEVSAVSAGTAARVGARVAQLEYAAAASDSLAWQRIAATLADLVTSIEGASPVAQQLRAGRMLGGEQRATVARQLRDLSGAASAFDVGVWLETARLAAASGRSDYFRTDGDARASLQHVTTAIERDLPNWSSIISQLKALERDTAELSVIRSRVDSAMAAFPR
jgi:hypothetical protein